MIHHARPTSAYVTVAPSRMSEMQYFLLRNALCYRRIKESNGSVIGCLHDKQTLANVLKIHVHDVHVL